MHEPSEGAKDRSTGPAVVLAAALLVAALGAMVAGQAAGAPPAEPPGGRPDAAAAHAEVDPAQHDIPGWFTVDQAERGRELYATHCAECHSPDLRARSTYISLYAYPALTGAYFWDRWGGQSVHTLLLVIQETMPLHAPGTLDGEEYADITAHILAVNGFPIGDDELPAAADDVERLVAMPIEPDFARPQARAQEVAERRPPEPDEPVEALAEEPAEEPEEPEEEEPAPEDEPDEMRDGWFTEEQVERARAPYFRHCSRCHGVALEGVGVAPSLAGPNFMERWDGESVADLFWVVAELMPLDDQGALTPWTSADLVAYILAQNDFEPGTVELPADERRLEPLVIGEEPEDE
jgi:mono/diheme cytochrome c family protein